MWVWALLVLQGNTVSAALPVTIATAGMRLQLTDTGGELARWEACLPDCAAPRSTVVFNGPGDPPQLRLTLDGRPLPPALLYTVTSSERLDEDQLRLRSEPRRDGLRVTKLYRIARDGYRLVLEVSVDRGTSAAGTGVLALGLDAGGSLLRREAEGFSGWSEGIRAFSIDSAGEVSLAPGASVEVQADVAGWRGLRNRFWVLACRAGPMTGSAAARFECYAGPLDLRLLQRQAPGLDAALFPGLWRWMRGLTLGLSWLLDRLVALIGQPGPAVIALALVVKLLMAPLSALAGRWQRQVNLTQSRLEPKLREIRRDYRGEEQVRHIIELYRSAGVHPLYSLKSLFGLLIQIPIFIAAYHALGEHPALLGSAFLWCKDLSRPDHWWRLPVTVPFFGGYLNLLPLLMTAVSVLAARGYDAAGLTEPLRRRQRLHLYLLAAAFLALFYTFPAGMVLYWTSNNVLELLKERARIVYRAVRRQ